MRTNNAETWVSGYSTLDNNNKSYNTLFPKVNYIESQRGILTPKCRADQSFARHYSFKCVGCYIRGENLTSNQILMSAMGLHYFARHLEGSYWRDVARKLKMWRKIDQSEAMQRKLVIYPRNWEDDGLRVPFSLFLKQLPYRFVVEILTAKQWVISEGNVSNIVTIFIITRIRCIIVLGTLSRWSLFDERFRHKSNAIITWKFIWKERQRH